MSHHAGGHVPPYVSSCVPNAAYAGGNTTFTIEGNRFSPTMKVDVPAGLGTLVSKTISYPTANTCRVVLVINVVEPTTTGTDYTVTLSNGGEFSSDSTATVTHVSFVPTILIKGSNDYWWNPDSLNATTSTGDKLSSYASSAGSLTLTQATSYLQPEFAKDHVWSTGKTASGYGGWSRKFQGPVALASAGGTGNLDGFTIAAVMHKEVASNYHSLGPYNRIESGHKTIEFKHKGATETGWAFTSYTSDASWFSGSDALRTVFYTLTPTQKRLVVPQISLDISTSYTPGTVPTGDWASIFGASGANILYGETLILSYAISDSERADLQAYWANKYGA